MESLKIAVIGGGSWGTTVASVAGRNMPVSLYLRDGDIVNEINEKRTNEKYLPGAKISHRVTATNDLQQAVTTADVVVMGIPAQSFRDVLLQVKRYIRPWVPVISLTKGLESRTDLRMTQIIQQELSGHPAGVLSGPNLAREVMSGQAAATVLAMEDDNVVKRLQDVFHSGIFRVYTNRDVVGCELGGILKNIVAIAVGMGMGLGAGDNTRAALITRGLGEISRLGVALGGKKETFFGLAGMGDLMATCISPQSRNYHVGVELGKGHSLDKIIKDMHMVAEGVKSAPAVMALARQCQVEMPIVQDVYQVVSGEKTAKEAFRGLLRSAVGEESQPG